MTIVVCVHLEMGVYSDGNSSSGMYVGGIYVFVSGPLANLLRVPICSNWTCPSSDFFDCKYADTHP